MPGGGGGPIGPELELSLRPGRRGCGGAYPERPLDLCIMPATGLGGSLASVVDFPNHREKPDLGLEEQTGAGVEVALYPCLPLDLCIMPSAAAIANSNLYCK